MAITLNGTTGVTTTGLTSNGIDDNATSTAMTLDSSGNVGIGNTSPSSYNTGSRTLVIGDGGTEGISIHAGTGMLHFTNGADTTERVSIKSTVASNTLEFTTGGSEAMRLDASGNLLLGKSSSGSSVRGSELRDGTSGFVATFKSDADGINIDRSTDGSLINLRKDGTTVGSIGIESGGLTIDGEAGHAGLRFGGADISPRDGGADADNAIQLGSTVNRFTDLYLSGGVYLGGTGAGNKLDDYERGEWTPAFEYASNGTLSVSYNQRYGGYTKVGQNVTVFGLMRLSAFSKGTASGELFITGLPFSSTTVGHRSAVPVLTYRAPFNGPGGFGAMVDNGVSYINCVYSRNNNTWATEADPDGNSEYFFEVTYRTDA